MQPWASVEPELLGERKGWHGFVQQPPLTLPYRQPPGRWECCRTSRVQAAGGGCELPLNLLSNVLVEQQPECRASSSVMTAMWPLPLLSMLPSLPAGRCKRVTDVGRRRAAKCPSLRVQSWMLISISSISCSNTDLSRSRALLWAALYLPCTLTWLPLGEWGQIVRCLCGSRL